MLSALDSLLPVLRRVQLRAGPEANLQDAIEGTLTAAGLSFEREVILAQTSRIDFMVGDIGVELKVAGSRADVLRQLQRYALEPRVAGLVLVTSCFRHVRMPETLADKPLRVVHLFGGCL